MTVREDITALVEGFVTGQTTPEAVARSCLEAISVKEAELNALSALSQDIIERSEAATRRWKRNSPMGPLDGIPIVVKDNLHVAGFPTSWGNAHLARQRVDHDQAAAAALRAAGALFVGKANTPEFAIEGYTGNDTFGTTLNPLNPNLTPGGSSGGVVAAVASGMALAGLATDGGGSIRRPAGYTGLWGLRTAPGVISPSGGPPQILRDFETIGPICRSARDVALLFGVLAGEPLRQALPIRSILAVRGLPNSPCDPGILSAFDQAASAFADIGYRISFGELPFDISALGELWPRVSEIGLAQLFAKEPEIAATANPRYLELAETGRGYGTKDIEEISRCIDALRDAINCDWRCDAILMPSAAAPPWSAQLPYPGTIAGEAVGPRGHAAFTGWVNAAGLAALAIPLEEPGSLPVGIQLIAQAGREGDLIDVGRKIETRKNFTEPMIQS